MFDKQCAKHQEAKKAVHFVTWKRAHYQLSAIKEQFPGSPKANILLIECQWCPYERHLTHALKEWNWPQLITELPSPTVLQWGCELRSGTGVRQLWAELWEEQWNKSWDIQAYSKSCWTMPGVSIDWTYCLATTVYHPINLCSSMALYSLGHTYPAGGIWACMWECIELLWAVQT